MEEENRLQGSPEHREATGPRTAGETDASGGRRSEEGRRGPTWRGWVLSILVAIALSVTATLLLGGSAAFRPDRVVAGGAAGGGCGSGAGSSCCPPAGEGK